MSGAAEPPGPPDAPAAPGGASVSGGDGRGGRPPGAAPDGEPERSNPPPGREPEGEGQPQAARARRFWSVRRAPAAVVSVLLLAGVVVLLYDVASVRAGRPGMAWRRTLADELATRTAGDTVSLAGAAVVAALGLWLLVLALTPGLRGLLPMRRGSTHVRAGLERGAARLVLRDRAMEVPGVQSVRIRLRGRRVRARAQAHFRDLDDVRADLDTALGEGIRELGLARRLRPAVRVRRPKKQ